MIAVPTMFARGGSRALDRVDDERDARALAPAFAARLRAPAGAPLTTFTICRYAAGQRFWALREMGLARGRLAATPGLVFHRLLGSGAGRGFSMVPDLSRYALLATWSSEQAADEFFADAPQVRRWRAHARDMWTVKLLNLRTRGSWARARPFDTRPLDLPDHLPTVALTRASLRLRAFLSFWRRVPAINRDLLAAPGLRLALGVGELPWLRPITFSVWDTPADLERFAHADSHHHQAARAAQTRGWFREDLFARFTAIATQGHLAGRDPCGFQPALEDMSLGPAPQPALPPA